MTSLVLVYGSLKQGFYNHSVLAGASYLGTYVTPPKYTMYDMGSYPAIEMGGDTAISCEVYEVAGMGMKALDSLEGYPHFYNRKLLDTPYGEAWIYFIEEHAFCPSTAIPTGVWRGSI